MSVRTLVAFGDQRLQGARDRLLHQARAIEVFDGVQILDERDLKPTSLSGVHDKLSTDLPGFGYWVWKPAVILQVLDSLEEGDLVLYVDIGCHLNVLGRARLEEYFSIVEADEKGLVCFQARPPDGPLVWDGRLLPNYVDAAWAKGDLLDFFGVRHRSDVIGSATIGAGVILMKNNPFVRQFLEKWLTIMTENWNLLDDTESVSPNHPWFRENRHDQAIFSLMSKLEGLTTLSAFEYWYPSRDCPGISDWESLNRFPIHARRDKAFQRRSALGIWLGRQKTRVKQAHRAWVSCVPD